ncbi:hypothetical protein ACH5RR_038544 [Cinchona calisaya]|uniref:Uncharacterized protein n=1 Tax=Cinchona calisaya TaxID=153742 RepID=A0ABD2XY49_9GENT
MWVRHAGEERDKVAMRSVAAGDEGRGLCMVELDEDIKGGGIRMGDQGFFAKNSSIIEGGGGIPSPLNDGWSGAIPVSKTPIMTPLP